ncbi:MAG: hypothetical protein AB7S72_20165 [Draconibacterium sp.]
MYLLDGGGDTYRRCYFLTRSNMGVLVTNKFQVFGNDNASFPAGRTPYKVIVSYTPKIFTAPETFPFPFSLPPANTWVCYQQPDGGWDSAEKKLSDIGTAYASFFVSPINGWSAGFDYIIEESTDNYFVSYPQALTSKTAPLYYISLGNPDVLAGEISVDWYDSDEALSILTTAADILPIGKGKQFLDSLPQPDGTTISRYASKFYASKIKITKNI